MCRWAAYDPADALLDPVWGLLAEAGMPVVIHCGSGPAPGKHTGPEPIGAAAGPASAAAAGHRAHGDAGVRGLPGPRASGTGRAPGHDDGVHGLLRAGRAVPAGRSAGRLAELGDRVLFGSDFPNIPYGYAHALEALTRLELGEEWLRGVCHGNAARLFGV